MQRDRHVRGPFGRLLRIAITILIGGFALVWAWNTGVAEAFGAKPIDYGQALMIEAVAAVLAIVASVVFSGGHRSRHGLEGQGRHDEPVQ